nr:GntR family transcriptional regulator [uncultured Enterobacter sp.]
MLDLEKAQRMSLTMQVEVSLKSALIVGALKPGARLITKEIADQLGTSITPVREALLRLVSSGALHATPAQAFLVPEVSKDRYNEINKIRKKLEGMAASVACAAMTPEKLASLHLLAAAFQEARISRNVEQTLQANRTFRFRVYEYAEMPTLTSLIEQLWVRIGPCFNYLYPLSEGLVGTEHAYDELLVALDQGDCTASQQAVINAIDAGAKILLLQYDN